MYIFFRILFFAIIFIILFLLIRKSKIYKRSTILILFIVCTFLSSLSHLIPIENYFISFDSPQEVFNYTNSGEIVDMIYGENSCLVIYSKGKDSYSHTIILKSSNGYEISKYFTIKRKTVYIKNYGHVEISNVLDNNDLYIIGSIITSNDEIRIVDKENLEFKVIKVNEINDDKTFMIYARVKDITDDYYIIINDQKFYLS